MCPLRRVEIGQEYLKAQRKGQSYLLLTYQRMVSPSANRNKTGGKMICCRFQNINAHVEQERPELNPLRHLPEKLEEFVEYLMDVGVPAQRDAPASSSRESVSEPRGKVVSRKHSIYTHFAKDRNCDICTRTKITRAPSRNAAVPRAENVGDLITAKI